MLDVGLSGQRGLGTHPGSRLRLLITREDTPLIWWYFTRPYGPIDGEKARVRRKLVRLSLCSHPGLLLSSFPFLHSGLIRFLSRECLFLDGGEQVGSFIPFQLTFCGASGTAVHNFCELSCIRALFWEESYGVARGFCILVWLEKWIRAGG